MSRGLGIIQQIILEALPSVARPAVYNGKDLVCCTAANLAEALFEPGYTISDKATMVRALKALAKRSNSGVKVFYGEVATRRGSRVQLCIEFKCECKPAKC